MVDERRVRILREGNVGSGPVLYVMGRDFRAQDNWALLYAQEQAKKHKVPLGVLVHFGRNLVQTNERHHSFLVEGLQETATELESNGIPFFLTFGNWEQEVKQFVEVHEIGLIVTDFSPLHESRWWWDEVSHGVAVPIHEVDAHNVVPAWLVSDKQEFAAYTFRRKVHKLLPEFLVKFPKLEPHPYDWGVSKTACWPRGVDKNGCALIDWEGVRKFRKFDSSVRPVTSIKSGGKTALQILDIFIKEKIKNYDQYRNDPTRDVLSQLSPYIRFGQISAQRIAYEVKKLRRDVKSRDSFLEELIVRRELAENFCFYNDNYDNFDGVPSWAKESLSEHKKDKRDYIYTLKQFEKSETHDLLWNAAQTELVENGKMHGFMRMYWAKKILEWTKTPEEAIKISILLNDRYSLDGRDPNGYAGVLWSIGGLHDRAWAKRPVFGKVRYMNYSGCKRKFDVETYIQRYHGSSVNV